MKTRVITATLTLLFFLSLSFPIVAEAFEISYDDGLWEEGWSIASAYKVGVMFTENNLPYSNNLLNSINIYAIVYNANQHLTMYVFDSKFNTILGATLTPSLQVGTGWQDIDVSSYNIVLDNSFLIGLQWVNTSGVYLGYDKNNPDNNGHSYDYTTPKPPFWGSPSDPTGQGDYGSWMIRADVSAVPLPPTFLLLGSGLLSLTGWRWVRKS